MSLEADWLADFKKKIRILKGMDKQRRERVLNGLVDGMALAAVSYPGRTDLPGIRPEFDPDYEAGYDVGETWAKLSMTRSEK